MEDKVSTSYDEVAPDASAMIESMRAHGYTLASAVADLIDNSIAAASKNVWLRFEWAQSESWISIVDDGHGMTESALIGAMRLGSRSPLEQRDESDLGRFGFGLKTASFSQARRLTVVSRKGDSSCVRRWDLDYLARPDVKGWQLLRSPHPSTGIRAELLEQMDLDHGTQILLENIDRVTGDPGTARERDQEQHFLWHIDRVREHLAMVFHRFLERKNRNFRIYVNDAPIEPWDPFLESHRATQPVGEYSERLDGHSRPIRVEGFVLPHSDRFENSDAHRTAGGPNGWNAQQGFYLYRAERLIIPGDWLQLRWQKEEHFKLARIRIDIPNSMDHEWQIDVKKSTASPPSVLREWLTAIAQEVRKVAKEVYSHRGKYGTKKKSTTDAKRPWVTVNRPGGEFCYRIDRKHPLLRPLVQSLSEHKRNELEVLLRLIEETVPVQRIWIDSAENQEGAAVPFSAEPSQRLRKLLLLCYETKVRMDKVGSEEAWDVLAAFEGFQGSEAQAIIAQLRSEGDNE